MGFYFLGNYSFMQLKGRGYKINGKYSSEIGTLTLGKSLLEITFNNFVVDVSMTLWI